MVSTSKAVILPAEQGVGQGDVFKDVKYSYIDSEDGDSVEVMELTFPYALIVSQSCDVAYMDDFESGETSAAVKYMPSILMCPIYPKDLIKHGEHLKEVFSYLDRNIIFFKRQAKGWTFVRVLESFLHQSLINRRLGHIFLNEDDIIFVYNNRVRKYDLNTGELIANQQMRDAKSKEYSGKDVMNKFVGRGIWVG